MAKQKVASELETTLKGLFAKAEPADVAILTFGFVSGWEGVTVLDYLIKSVSGAVDSSTGIGKLKANAAALDSDVEWLFANSPTGALAKLLGGLQGSPPSSPSPMVLSRADALTQVKAYEAKLALACMGAVVAYAVTRPGFLPAMLQMAATVGGDIAKLAPMALAGL